MTLLDLDVEWLAHDNGLSSRNTTSMSCDIW